MIRFALYEHLSASVLNDLERRVSRLERLYVETPLSLVETSTGRSLRVDPVKLNLIRSFPTTDTWEDTFEFEPA